MNQAGSPTCLITGGSGFVGSALRARLAAGAVPHTNFDRSSPGTTSQYETFRCADIRDRSELTDAMQGHTDVFHLAAEWNDVGVPDEEYRTTNVAGTENLAAAATDAGVNRIVFVSSCSVYDFDGSNQPFDEDQTAENPPTLYGQTKLEGEHILQKWAQADPQRSLKIVRPSVIYGPGNRGNVYNLARQVLSGKFVLPKGSTAYKSISYVDNVAEFLLFLAGAEQQCTVLNYCDLPQMTTDRLVRAIRRIGDTKAPLIRLPPSVLLAGAAVADRGPPALRDRFGTLKVKKFMLSTRLGTKRLLSTGFQQPLATEAGLSKTIEAIKQQGMDP